MALLRESGKHAGADYDLSAVLGEGGETSGIPDAALLIEFAEAALDPDDGRMAAARQAVQTTLGGAALADAAGVAALFNAIDRVADSTGIPLEDEKAAATVNERAALGIDKFGHTAAE